MPLQATWLGRNDIERITDVRLRCYAHNPGKRDDFIRLTTIDRFTDGDVLVLSDDTGDVATATSLSLTVNIRGTHLPCQGVAWVGTVRSHRRRRVEGRGLASRVMDAIREKARERGQAVSMLAPFRVSFYEKFGYGAVERQHTWTIPLSILPDVNTGHFSEYRDADFDAALANRRRQFEQSHGDVATDAVGLRHWLDALKPSGFRFVDRQGDRITSQFSLTTEYDGDQGTAVVNKPFWDSPAALGRLLAMLGTLRDQYSLAKISLPANLPLNWWLAERQIPHRRVDHPAARCQLITRMQAAVLDVPAFVAALRPRADVNGRLTINISGTTYGIDITAGHATATPATGLADVTTDTVTWAAIAFGDLRPDMAELAGRLKVETPTAVDLLADLTAGSLPYCHEYF